MKEYPSIPKFTEEFLNRECYIFKKEDGSNIRVSWSRKSGWNKFGTRHHLFDKSHNTFGCIIDLFNTKYAEGLEKIIVDNFPKCDSVIIYMEFLGPYSFAGIHDPAILQVENNEPKELILFDVNVNKRGFLSPKDFLRYFGKVRSTELIYEGKLTEGMVKKIRESEFGLNEGVVCKSQTSAHNRWQCKIKTWEYLKKIQKFFGTSWGAYWE